MACSEMWTYLSTSQGSRSQKVNDYFFQHCNIFLNENVAYDTMYDDEREKFLILNQFNKIHND